MKSSYTERLCCPACRERYNVRVISGGRNIIETAFLTCPKCCVSIPVLRGFPIFDQQFLAERDPADLERKLFGKAEDYKQFLQSKGEKPVYDLYAAFQPFNESTQCIFPLISMMREILHPGDLILDLWCRTGWSGELLASLFPEQQIISIWEGASGLLGLKGFDYWLGSGKRRENLDIVFHSPNNPLPFADGTFAIVHGLDTLHRYHHVPLIAETLRVVTNNGIVVFPHNHLTNSEPEPYFDRGEDQLHGREYQDYFDRLLKGTARKAFIWSEKALFDASTDLRLISDPETTHYNALILLCDKSFEGRALCKEPKTTDRFSKCFAVSNPLWSVDLTRGSAAPNPDAMDSGGKELFYRHPIYYERLRSLIALNDQDKVILYWASRFKTISEIAQILNRDEIEIFDRLIDLESKELVQLQNVSPAMSRLQSFYSTQRIPASQGKATLANLWMQAVTLHAEKPALVWPQDGSTFTYSDADRISRMASSFLKAHGVERGDKILVDACLHPEFLFLFWGAVLAGVVMVPVNPETKAYEWITKRVHPKLTFVDPSMHDGVLKNAIAFGVDEESGQYEGSFSQQLGNYDPMPDMAEIREDEEAAILFTSGSTGVPKGVVLSHGALFRTSGIIDRAYKFRNTDRFLSAGSFHTMSGLRNPCIAILHSGASVLIPQKAYAQNPLAIMNLCMKHQATVLNVAPAFLAYWSRAAAKAKYYDAHKLRMVLSTGSTLHKVHRELFEELFHTPVFDYYGLTETTGACILQTEETGKEGIGRPWESLVRLTDDCELAIYSENLMLRYLDDPGSTAQRIRNGWLFSGDIARILPSGCVELIGRKDRMMIDKNGENVYPEEIEYAIHQIDGIADCYVTQIQDAQQMEQIVALVQFAPGVRVQDSKQRMDHLRSILLEKLPVLHVPSAFLEVSNIPRGASGKVSADTLEQLKSAAFKQEIGSHEN